MGNFERLRLLRETIGVTQGDFAKTIGVAPSFISGIERNKKDLSRDLLEKILKNYNVNLNWLLTGEGEMFLSNQEKPLVPVNKDENRYKIPLLNQSVSCGSGENWESDEFIQEWLDIFSLVPRLGTGRHYAYKARGSSMLGVGIRNGDYLIFNAEAGNAYGNGIYVFTLNGEMYCKWLEYEKINQSIKVYSRRFVDFDKAELIRTIDTTDSTQTDDFRIFGRVRWWIHPNADEGNDKNVLYEL